MSESKERMRAEIAEMRADLAVQRRLIRETYSHFYRITEAVDKEPTAEQLAYGEAAEFIAKKFNLDVWNIL